MKSLLGHAQFPGARFEIARERFQVACWGTVVGLLPADVQRKERKFRKAKDVQQGMYSKVCPLESFHFLRCQDSKPGGAEHRSLTEGHDSNLYLRGSVRHSKAETH